MVSFNKWENTSKYGNLSNEKHKMSQPLSELNIISKSNKYVPS